MGEQDPFDDPEWEELASHVMETMVPKMNNSFMGIVSIQKGAVDVELALTLGFCLTMDKPIIVLIEPGAKIPDGLRRAADVVIEGEFDDAMRPLVRAAIEKIHGDHVRKEQDDNRAGTN